MYDNVSKTKTIAADPHGASALSDLLAHRGFNSPDLFVQQIDVVAETAAVLRMSREAYRAATFLDSRLLSLTPDGFIMPHAHLVRWTQAITEAPRPIHFIFHTGHVGSTLISRLIDEADGVLGLREPAALRSLASAHDRMAQANPPLSPFDYETWFATQLRLWRRGYSDTRCVVLKTTSDTARVGHKLLNDAPDARAILLNVAPENYLAHVLSAHRSSDVQSKLPERLTRVRRLLGELEQPASLGQAVALSWLAEQLTHDRIAHPWPQRILRVDFDAFLADPSVHLAAIFRHIQIDAPASLRAGNASNHQLMRQYSKCPERTYSVADRVERLALSRRDNAPQIKDGLAWLERVARLHPYAATALAA